MDVKGQDIDGNGPDLAVQPLRIIVRDASGAAYIANHAPSRDDMHLAWLGLPV